MPPHFVGVTSHLVRKCATHAGSDAECRAVDLGWKRDRCPVDTAYTERQARDRPYGPALSISIEELRKAVKP